MSPRAAPCKGDGENLNWQTTPQTASRTANAGFRKSPANPPRKGGRLTPNPQANDAQAKILRAPKARCIPAGLRGKRRRICAAIPSDYSRARRDKAENIPAESQECDTLPQSARHKNGSRLTGRLSRRARIFFPILAAVAEICTARRRDGRSGGKEVRTYYAPQRFRRLRNPLYLFRKLRGNFIPQTSGFSRRTVSIGNRQD